MHVIKSAQKLLQVPCIANVILFLFRNDYLTQQIRTEEDKVKEYEAK